MRTSDGFGLEGLGVAAWGVRDSLALPVMFATYASAPAATGPVFRKSRRPMRRLIVILPRAALSIE
jgi:hypothetical protein